MQGVKRYCFFCRVMSGTHFRYWYENSTMLMLKSTVLWSLWREIKAPEHTRSLIWSGGYPIHVSVHKILRQYILAVGLVEMVVADLVRVHTWRHLQPHSLGLNHLFLKNLVSRWWSYQWKILKSLERTWIENKIICLNLWARSLKIFKCH